jgi:protein required for attachment to host cells
VAPAGLQEVHDLVHPAVGSDDPDSRGRGFDGRGGTRHGLEPKTLLGEHDAAQFAQELGRFLQRELDAKHFQTFVLVAAADWLGHLRQTLHHSVKTALTKTLSKDLLQCSTAELLERLKAEHCL